MMKKNKLMWVLAFLTLIVTAIVLPAFPDKVPMHYDMAGKIDRWGSKYEQYLFPVIILGFALFWQLMSNYYVKKAEKLGDSKEGREADSNGKVISFAGIGTTLMFSVMHFAFLIGAYHEAKAAATVASIDINMIIGVMMGLLLIATGNYMPKSRRNPIIGFRTSKTMSSDENWAKANRFAGIVFMISGALTVVLSLVFGGIVAMSIFLGILIVDVILCLIYASKL